MKTIHSSFLHLVVVCLLMPLSLVVPRRAAAQDSFRLNAKADSVRVADSINAVYKKQVEEFEKAQSRRRFSVGIFAGANLNIHTANFLALPGDVGYNATAPNFLNTTGVGFSGGVMADIPFSEVVSIGLRAGFGTFGSPLQAPEPMRIGVLSNNGTTTTFYDAQFGRVLTPALNNAFVEPTIILSPFASVPDLRLHIGGRVGFYLSPTYTQVERLITPTDNEAVFGPVGLTKERNQRSGAIPNVQALNLAAIAGVSYEFYTMSDPKKESGFVIAPEIFFSYGVNPVVQNLVWNVHQGRAGIAVRYMTAPPPPPPPPPPLPPVEPLVRAKVAAFGIDTNGVESPLVKVRVEEYVSRQLYPMLGFVFFDGNSSELPKKYVRYLKEAGSIDEEFENFNNRFYRSDMMKVYYDLLNILGDRLKKKESIKITLTGCNDNNGPEANNMELSYKRALTVRDYLHENWEIDTSRMEIKVRNLPELATNSIDTLAGRQENRRVEITSSDPTLLDPLLVYDTLSVCSLQKIRFQMDAVADAGYQSSRLEATQGRRQLKSYASDGKDSESFMWNIAEEPGSMPNAEQDMEYRFVVTDKRGVSDDDGSAIPVEYVSVRKKRAEKVKDKQVDTYRLISFDFNSTGVGNNNSKIINEYINPYLTANSRISAIGYTDRLGGADVNQRLSDGRAKSVAGALKTGKVTSLGVGARKPLYNNETPEGRFYNRTVEVRVETTIE
jgi:outer membrane protein OmpA-like peptidoglycan-associated protein